MGNKEKTSFRVDRYPQQRGPIDIETGGADFERIILDEPLRLSLTKIEIEPLEVSLMEKTGEFDIAYTAKSYFFSRALPAGAIIWIRLPKK